MTSSSPCRKDQFAVSYFSKRVSLGTSLPSYSLNTRGRAEAVSGKKMLRIPNYRVTCGRGLIIFIALEKLKKKRLRYCLNYSGTGFLSTEKRIEIGQFPAAGGFRLKFFTSRSYLLELRFRRKPGRIEILRLPQQIYLMVLFLKSQPKELLNYFFPLGSWHGLHSPPSLSFVRTDKTGGELK